MVHPNYQNLGLGKKMIKFIIEHSIKNNFDSIRFDVFSKNKNALNLYSRFNCVKKGEVLFQNTKDVFYCYELLI
ncbi:GNAT family N-acetyltransferase [Leptospira yanagawae]|uniref:GNAT family N-acetyltransferase n=1 Tax=Leptospira yanagawae TaxID=293069 RepID=UPI003CC66421